MLDVVEVGKESRRGTDQSVQWQSAVAWGSPIGGIVNVWLEDVLFWERKVYQYIHSRLLRTYSFQ